MSSHATGLREYCELRNIKERVFDFLKKSESGEHAGTMKKCALIMRCVLETEDVSPIDWLAAQSQKRKIYWSSRGRAFESAGAGIADCCQMKEGFSLLPNAVSLEDRVHGTQDIPYFGGFSFYPETHSQHWNVFGCGQMIAPMFEVFRNDRKTWFAFNVHKRFLTMGAEMIKKAVQNIEFSCVNKQIDRLEMLSRCDRPDWSIWEKGVRHVLDRIQKGSVAKAVLARETGFTLKHPVNCVSLASHLFTRNPDCYNFLFQFDNHLGFLGSSPERLFRLKGEEVLTEAVAGTRPRNNQTGRDEALGEELFHSKKDKREQQFVVDDIVQRLHTVCRNVQKDDAASLLKTKGGQHLITRMKGNRKEGIGVNDVLRALHPTPAVGGVPRNDSLKLIKGVEPFDRGWYAGPFGYVSQEESEFAVAIRSGLLNGRKLNVYAGAGIVEGSDPKGEWEEIEHKINLFSEVLHAAG